MALHSRQVTAFGGSANLSESSAATQPGSPPSGQQLGVQDSWLGWPRFKWSLTLFGLCVYTFAVVTFRAPVGNAGALIAVVGMFLQPSKLRMPFPIWIFGAFLLWAFIASLVSSYSDVALDNVLEEQKLVVIMLVVVSALQTEGLLRFYLMFFLGCFVLFLVRRTLFGGDKLLGAALSVSLPEAGSAGAIRDLPGMAGKSAGGISCGSRRWHLRDAQLSIHNARGSLVFGNASCETILTLPGNNRNLR